MTPALIQSFGQIDATFTAKKQLQHPYEVEQKGMTRLNLGEDLFQAMNVERRLWLDENCTAPVSFDQLPRGAGQKYLFADPDEAFHFKLRFGARVFP
ncbi:MAG: hypothetical protein J0J10_20060 [Bosea sp.]|uniref:hypothetical protein n=1 Tax=Bosea sp. (in: a-proteobacteria) TaxID=1871050 RepID=UPI001AC5EF45|nr:hypothetical protein [Bosea sp. (in: a-proteobacteria)]MBN9471067.1 hypothetical protein [Bosea sp. (in: a-proteobacteria)]